MKTLIISLLVAALFVIGCQENSITDPVVNEQVEKNQNDIPETYIQGSLILNTVLDDPYPIGNSFYRLNGNIDYELRMIYADPIPPTAQRYISVYMQVDADLRYFCTVCPPNELDELSGFVTEVSESFIPVGGNTVSLLEKTFQIQGRDDGMVLKARFSVSNDRIEVNALWLALPTLDRDATDNKQS